MANEQHFLAVDLGAESGRGELVTLSGRKVSMRELHRFPNTPVRLASTLHWNFLSLYAEVLNCLRACAQQDIRLSGISIDTWGVDFGLLGRDDVLLSSPVHYRDARTEGIHARAAAVMPIEEIFDATALQTMPINTLFQLHAMQLADSPVLEAAETLLMMPDLFGFYLTGVKASELSIAQTSQLIGLDGRWSETVIGKFHLPEKIFPRLIEPAGILGELKADVAEAVHLPVTPVIACAGHDTGAAVAAVPGEGNDWAFLSCGTWSILGSLVDKPVHSRACYEAGFTNEITYGRPWGWYLGRNIFGLWLVQELRRKWDSGADGWDYARMTAEAAKAEPGPLVNADDPSLLAPADMEAALLQLISRVNQPAPASRGQLVRCVLESLALQYAWGIDMIGSLTGNRPQSLYMVGGGIANKLLCQFTANACGIPVHAGADQCTALGNAMGQAMAVGSLDSPDDIRDVMRNSFTMTTHQPQDQPAWSVKRKRYAEIQQA